MENVNLFDRELLLPQIKFLSPLTYTAFRYGDTGAAFSPGVAWRHGHTRARVLAREMCHRLGMATGEEAPHCIALRWWQLTPHQP